MTRAGLYAFAAVLLAACLWRAFDWAAGIGETRCELRHAKAAESAAKEVDRREKVSADATGSMLDYLAASMPASETRTNEAIERIRVVYRDRPVPAECAWPDRVRDELAEVIQRANTAAR